MNRLLNPGLHSYDALQLGDYFDTHKAKITTEMIHAFAELTGDRFEIHLSDAGAQKHGFPAQVAHGLLVMSLIEGLKSQAKVQLNSFAALGWDWTFKHPVVVHDEIECRVTLMAMRNAGPKSGLLTLDLKVLNQRGQTVQQGSTRLMVHRL